MNVLIGCESSGVIREAFRKLGHNAYSCDLLPADDGSPYHIQASILDIMAGTWDLLGFHPPCTFLCSSGLHWNRKDPVRKLKTLQSLDFVRCLMAHPGPYYLENPVGRIGTAIRKADQLIQPYEFGDDASKLTCLWLKGLPPLVPTTRAPARIAIHQGKPYARYSNQSDRRNDLAVPGPDRWKVRSKSWPGIAQAMAEQWTHYLLNK
jgi:hypothetical protein